MYCFLQAFFARFCCPPVYFRPVWNLPVCCLLACFRLSWNLQVWSPEKDYDRRGTAERKKEILGVELPLIDIPVRSGRNLAIIVEIAARNWRLKSEGYDTVAELDRRLQRHYGRREDGED